MSTTIVADNAAGSTTPVAVDGYQARRQSRNRISDLLSGDLAVVLIPPRPRSGTLALVYDNETSAQACLALHGETTTFTLTSDSATGIDMSYVIDGEVTITINNTRTAWTVSVGYQEVVL